MFVPLVHRCLQLLRAKLQGYTQEGIFDAKGSSDIQLFLDYCIDYVCGRVDKLNENALLQQYGPISDLKITLRENINRLGFMELLDLYKEYKEKENLLCSKARHAGMKLMGSDPIKRSRFLGRNTSKTTSRYKKSR